MDHFVYLNIVRNILLPFAEEKLPVDWIYQADNDPKHTAKIVIQFLNEKNVNSIPIDRCIRLIQSMQRRCAAVIKANGKTTKY